MGLIAFTSVVIGLSRLIPAWLFLDFLRANEPAGAQRYELVAGRLLLVGALVAALVFVSSVLERWFREWLRFDTESRLRREVLQRLHRKSLASFGETAGERAPWMSELRKVERFVWRILPDALVSASVLLGAGALFAYETGSLVLLPLSLALLIAAVMMTVGRMSAPTALVLRGIHEDVFGELVGNLEGARTIQGFAAERFVHARFQRKLESARGEGLRKALRLGVWTAAGRTALLLSITVLLAFLALAIGRGEVSFSQALVYPCYAAYFFLAARRLGGARLRWTRFREAGERLSTHLYADECRAAGIPALRSGDEPHRLSVSQLALGAHHVSAPDVSVARGETVVIEVCPGSRDFGFLEIVAGLRSAVGGSASLLAADGTLSWTTGGYDSPLRLPSGLCAYVERRPYLFQGTLWDNLVLGNEDVLERDEVWETLREVGLDELVSRGGGLEMTIGERGMDLGPGRRYLLALARALLQRRPFLLLDQPFSELDRASIAAVAEIVNRQVERGGVGALIVSQVVPRELRVTERKCEEDLVARFRERDDLRLA